MAIGPFDTYAPPNPYTRTLFENPVQGLLEALKVPIFIGEGNEYLIQSDLEVVRGSSSTVDQRIVQEDETGRAVVSISQTGVITLGDFDGVRTKFQVRNFPIVSGNGTGTTTNDRSDVTVTIDGNPIVVLQVDGTRGLITLATPPKPGEQVYCTYFFNRTDTLQTDNVSDQVSDDQAVVRGLAGIGDVDAQNPSVPPAVIDLHGDILNGAGAVVIAANNVLLLTVDGVDYTLTIPARNDYTMLQVATTIASLGAGSLQASTFINNFGLSTLLLTADHEIIVGAGSANSALGLQSGQADIRVRTFYTFNGPIVDGSNGGVITTDPADVTVKVNNVQVIPTSVNGTTRAVTLPFAPKAGSKVTIQYWYNTWQDTFDYLAHIGVTSVEKCGEIPGASTYTQGTDFILKDDKIVWGTSVLISSGVNTIGSVAFGENQVTATLIDNRTFLSECSPVTLSSGGVASASKVDFQLPFEPTTGNGRCTKLGSSLFQQVTNGRIDLPTNRPDLVDVYWGYGVQDALDRGKVEVMKVEGTVVTLKSSVPVGANVYASFYYNLLTDNEFTLTSVIPGISGTGTYQVTDQSGATVYNPYFDPGSKGTSLNGITIEFPSGSELRTDLHHEGLDGDAFQGPVQEIVTVQFATRPDTPAQFTSPGSELYEFIEGQSDRLRVGIDGQTIQFGSTAGGDLADPNGFGQGFFAEMVSDRIDYTGGTGSTVGVSYTLDSDEIVNLLIDGVQVATTVPAASNVDILHFAKWINEAASGHASTAQANEIATSILTLDPALRHPNDDHYVGWVLVIGTATTIDNAQAQVVTAYNGTTGVVTVGAAWTGGDTFVDAGDAYYLYNPDTMAVFKGSTLFNGPVTVIAGSHDQLSFEYVGDATGASGAITATINPGTFVTASDLASEIQTQMNAAAVLAGVAGVAGTAPGVEFVCEADSDGRMQFKFQLSGDDSVGYLTFLSLTPAVDLAVLVGVETGATVAGGQPHLLQGPVARASELTTGGFKPYDRMVLRNRILPGQLDGVITTASMSPDNALSQMGLEVQAGSGNVKAGLTTGASASGSDKAVVHPATMVGRVGFGGGTNDAAEPVVIFYDGTGVQPDNTDFSFTVDGVPVNVSFYGGPSGLPVGLGPVTGSGAVQESDTATAGGAATITLAAGASASNDYYNGWTIEITGGTGSGQVATITDYVGGTKVATVGTAWTTVPDATSTYTVTPPVLEQIVTAMATIPGFPLGATAAAVLQTGILLQDGDGIRITSLDPSVSSAVVIGDGAAADVLGFTVGAIAQRTLVSASTLASALMSNRVATFGPYVLEFPSLDSGVWTPATGATANYFADLAYASVETDATGNDYLYLESLTVGTASTVLIRNTTVGQDALFPGTGLNIVSGSGASGEAGLNGFFVTSSDTVNGSGTANTSVLNNGVGQDGVIGQTYRDAVTGLTFTILPRGFTTNENGPWLAYPTGANATFRINVSNTFITNANVGHNALNGVELTVSNTLGVVAGDTAIVETFERGGLEPANGDLYYVTYTYRKQDYTTAFFTRMANIEQAYGSVGPDSPVSLASYLAILNGAVVVGIKQVPRAEGSTYASLDTYAAAIKELEGQLPGNTLPDIITPLRGDSLELFQVLRRSNAIQSSIRYRSERTSIIGLAGGSLPRTATDWAQTLKDTRMRMVYPDMVTLSLQDALGQTTEALVDGPMLAAGLVGSVVSPNYDVASPWTNRRLVGYTQLARRLDAVEQNQVAQKGVTIIDEVPPFLRVRHGLTTDVTNVLTRTPTIIQIADEVQRQSRAAMESFIGIKFLPGILSQIEGRLAMVLNSLVKKNIIAAYTGIRANVSPDDPTVANVEAFYSPIFPLLYIVLTFHLRSSLT